MERLITVRIIETNKNPKLTLSGRHSDTIVYYDAFKIILTESRTCVQMILYFWKVDIKHDLLIFYLGKC